MPAMGNSRNIETVLAASARLGASHASSQQAIPERSFYLLDHLQVSTWNRE